MINPTTITDYNRTEAELEEFLMFAILVAGKTAKTQAKKLDQFLSFRHKVHSSHMSPFEFLESMKGFQLHNLMRLYKLGQYNRIENAFREIVKLKGKLKSVTIEDLEAIKGIGPKTARFFILHSRPNAEVACLDVHILKWLDDLNYPNIPQATPSKNRYGIIERYFLEEARKRNVSPADLDLRIWKSYATI